jgi:two-component system nitrogen regulation response regulator NtrX
VRRLKEQLAVAAPSNGWALITGENGTGKELVARQIHCLSRRAEGPFVEVNCAAIPEELIESELFGHEKGAFTGAVARKLGRFELAHGGTLFLDEIGDMSLLTQAKVLRILQERSFERVGGTETLEVDVRVIAATNKNLEEEIAEDRFREDLYYRLNVIPFHVPALRERAEDVEILARSFVEEFCAESGARPKELSEAALERLRRHSWPGNVRELRNLMERVVILSPGPRIDAADLPATLGLEVPANGGPPASLEAARREFEREYLRARLAEHDWNISKTAQAIGIARESLSRKIKTHRLEVQRD